MLRIVTLHTKKRLFKDINVHKKIVAETETETETNSLLLLNFTVAIISLSLTLQNEMRSRAMKF